MRRYRIRTWDQDRECYTPQIGLPEYVDGFAGLRNAIRELRRMLYTAHRTGNSRDGHDSDSYVLIEAAHASHGGGE